MATFKSYQDYWRFALSITARRRYIRNAEQTEFLRAVLATSVGRQEVIAAGSILWRAQHDHGIVAAGGRGGDDEGCPCPSEPKRMKPLTDRAREGRANPKGIPFLYLATQQKIAVAEVRPWIGSFVSVGQFRMKRKVRVVNCVTGDRRIMVYSGEPKPKERERAVWRDIDRVFSQPVTSTDDAAGYAPTQVLAEFFREHGLDGIAYGSSLAPGAGHNLALFDLDAAALVNCALVQIDGMKLDFSPAANPYVITNPPKGIQRKRRHPRRDERPRSLQRCG